MHPREQGVRTALARYGLVKAAVDISTPPGGWGRHLGNEFKELLIGNPRQFHQELQSGKLLARDGMIAQSANPIMPGRPIMTALALGSYALPAYAAYQALQGPKHQRGSSVGSIVGGTLGAAAGMPLGILGSMAGGALGTSLGETLGRPFDAEPPPGR